MSREITQEDKDYLWSLMPTWVKKVPSKNQSWDPTFYGTLSREGDLTVHNKVIQLLNQNKEKQRKTKMSKEHLDDIKYVHKNLMEGLKLPPIKMSKEIDYIKIVNNLNEFVNDKQGDDYIINFSYTTNGWYHCIEWDRLLLWDSETDGREWIEDENDYEDLEEYIKKEFNNYCDTLNTLRL
jgi:hypothetical protein